MDWYSGTIPDAILEVKNTHKVLLVFVIGDDELSKQMFAAYNEPRISDQLNSNNCVALKLVPNSIPYQQFCQIYPVVVIPSSFFIGKNGLPIEIITGSMDPEAFLEKITNIFQLNEESYKQDDASLKTETVSESVVEPMESAENEPSVANGCETVPIISVADTVASTSEASTSEEPVASNVDPSVPLEDRVQRAKVLIEAVRQTKAQEEAEKEKMAEQERRKMGKAVQQAKQTRQETELKEWAQSLAKDKEEERQARERVRAQIAQDRAERAARYKQVKADEAESQKQKEMERVKVDQEKATKEAAIRSTMARLQFRLPDGASVTHTFPADSTLGEARNFLLHEIQRTLPNFVLCSMFPRRQFTENNYAETLRDLELAPSAAILVLPGQAVVLSDPGGSFYGNLFWTLISPLLVVWKALTSLFRGTPQSGNQAVPSPPPSAEQPGPSGQQESSSTASSSTSSAKKRPSDKDESSGRGKSSRRREPEKFYREGNVYRISNHPVDDDENNTWNGNSTQQM